MKLHDYKEFLKTLLNGQMHSLRFELQNNETWEAIEPL